jgi:hypothetical protein
MRHRLRQAVSPMLKLAVSGSLLAWLLHKAEVGRLADVLHRTSVT